MRTIQQLVSAEIHYCVSGLVATLAGATAPGRTGNPLTDLVEQAKGEKVDRDFAGMTIWARTTSGQSIEIDSVIESIHADLVREYGA